MTLRLAGSAPAAEDSGIGSHTGLVRRPITQEFVMSQWIKPQATDLRYGFEITMYISNR